MIKRDVKKFLVEVKRFYKPGRFQEVRGYKFDKYIFRGAIILLFVLLVLILFQTGFNLDYNIYFFCPVDARGGFCENPFYKYCLYESCPFSYDYEELPPVFEAISDQATFPAGFEVGRRPPWLVSNFSVILGIILFLCFLSNHLIYNRGFIK